MFITIIYGNFESIQSYCRRACRLVFTFHILTHFILVTHFKTSSLIGSSINPCFFCFDRILYIRIDSLIYKTIIFLSRMRPLLLIIKYQDLDTGIIKTLNYVNGIVLWSDDEAGLIAFADNSITVCIEDHPFSLAVTIEYISRPEDKVIVRTRK